QRVQFRQPIAHFGMIQHKLAEMALRIFVLESMIYRIAGYWDRIFGQIDAAAPDAGTKYRAASEEYAVECAIIKFFGTEVLDYVVDEALQIHGGYGYSEEFPMARAYRDARINRIFEGTNEINRLTVMDQLLRRAQRGRLPLSEAIAGSQSNVPNPAADGSTELAEIGTWVRQMRRAILYTIGQAWEAFGEKLPEQQEVSAALADMASALFGLESASLRLRKLGTSSSANYAAMLAAAGVFGSDAYTQVLQEGRYVLAALGTGDSLSSQLDTLNPILTPPAIDTVALRRQVAALVIERDGYPFS
ncbi:MAG TPA: acyl-CoA dehydrogenase family protein, partial [Chthonomonadaceae bacterium]|nr:acyl-CoA dehydrogenase family protein [Chthonomonadaceae bacterium]